MWTKWLWMLLVWFFGQIAPDVQGHIHERWAYYAMAETHLPTYTVNHTSGGAYCRSDYNANGGRHLTCYWNEQPF